MRREVAEFLAVIIRSEVAESCGTILPVPEAELLGVADVLNEALRRGGSVSEGVWEAGIKSKVERAWEAYEEAWQAWSLAGDAAQAAWEAWVRARDAQDEARSEAGKP